MSTATRRSRACPGPCAGLCTPAGIAAAHLEHRLRLLSRARRLLDDPQQAEDVVQETFTRAWAACSSFDPTEGPPLAAWLATILRRVVIDLGRASAVRPRLQAVPDCDPDRGVPDATDAVVLRLVLLDALAGASTAHRAVVLGTVVRDRPYAAVAAELDVPVGTVKSRVFHALRGLRTHLTEQHRRTP